MLSAPMGSFNYPCTYWIGAARIMELAQACEAQGMGRPLVVTDPGVRALPWFAEVIEDLSRADLEVQVFSEISADPTGEDVDRGVQACREGRHDGIIGLGGGSAMDAAKAIALMVGQEGSVFDFEDLGDNWLLAEVGGILPTIAVPTTSGTGSEVGRCSVIVDRSDNRKKIIFHPKMMPVQVVADPELTLGLPGPLTAATGMDALAHAFEAFCCAGFHPMADGIALEGMALVKRYLPRCVADGNDLEARTYMMMAATMGATAFQKGLGMIHALSHPLGGRPACITAWPTRSSCPTSCATTGRPSRIR